MNSVLKAVRDKRVLVSDGAWGTFLVQAGMQPGECPELWCVERPEVVRDIARSYVEAGSDIVLTNSFGGTRFKLEAYGLADRVSELNEAAAKLSRQASGAEGLVVGSMGPTGKILMMGDVAEEEIYEAFKEQAIALERGGADAVDVETMTALDEACLGVRAVKENTGLEVICSFTFDTLTDTGYKSMMGVSPEEMAVAAVDAGADMLGTNCSLGSKEMVDVVKALHDAAPDAPVLVHPNAGRPTQNEDGTITYPETPRCMAGQVAELIAAGASIIGGCCGSGPDHIRAIRAAVDQALA